ncbi:hypothetical protein M9H77_09958 [Catharanthus roseus]|uniref:Uncharacterized protein n=1 Tax=Catharanthus roseus TaxID=4058 RepID=A0ACC0C2J3_CATRO|nr:hypothetical protein M9H77_09958 [Catharanthus roseus]
MGFQFFIPLVIKILLGFGKALRAGEPSSQQYKKATRDLGGGESRKPCKTEEAIATSVKEEEAIIYSKNLHPTADGIPAPTVTDRLLDEKNLEDHTLPRTATKLEC